MKKLMLSRNPIGDHGATAFAKSLKTNKSLRELNLSFCQIRAEGGKGLAAGLAVNAVMTECNVRGNNLDTDSARALAEVATKKGVMLFGIKHDQKEANFHSQGLGSVDAILIASDLFVSISLVEVRARSVRSRSCRQPHVLLCC